MNFWKGGPVAACCLALLLEFSAAGAAAEAAYAPRSVRAGDAVAAQRRRARRPVKRRAAVRAKAGRVAEGLWGGAHLRMDVSGGGATLEFDCAHGAITAPFETDSEGRFDLPGTYTREGPGPIRIGREPSARPARYAGRAEGERLTLNVKLEGSDESLGVYSLARGDEGRVVKCR